VDGNVHNDRDVMRRDQLRTERLWELGIQVLRFGNSDVLTRTEDVLRVIRRICEQIKRDIAMRDAETRKKLNPNPSLPLEDSRKRREPEESAGLHEVADAENASGRKPLNPGPSLPPGD